MKKIREKLLKKSDRDYKKFSENILPYTENILGVRMPVLRKLAKEIYLKQDWKSFINSNDIKFWEELVLQGMVIGEIKDKPENILQYVKNFVPKIESWGTCDSFCASLKFTKKNKELVWKFIQPYFNSTKEYEIRFAFVMALWYFTDEKYIDKILKYTDDFKDERYYAKMAAAWALSIIYIKFPEKTLDYLKHSNLSPWTFNKAIQKICESLRVDKETKKKLKTLKKVSPTNQ